MGLSFLGIDGSGVKLLVLGINQVQGAVGDGQSRGEEDFCCTCESRFICEGPFAG